MADLSEVDRETNGKSKLNTYILGELHFNCTVVVLYLEPYCIFSGKMTALPIPPAKCQPVESESKGTHLNPVLPRLKNL